MIWNKATTFVSNTSQIWKAFWRFTILEGTLNKAWTLLFWYKNMSLNTSLLNHLKFVLLWTSMITLSMWYSKKIYNHSYIHKAVIDMTKLTSLTLILTLFVCVFPVTYAYAHTAANIWQKVSPMNCPIKMTFVTLQIQTNLRYTQRFNCTFLWASLGRIALCARFTLFFFFFV